MARNRKRTRRATLARRINGMARSRQEAWLEGEQPLVTGSLTRRLDSAYQSLRDARSGEPGEPFQGTTRSVILNVTTERLRKARIRIPDALAAPQEDA